ncbi:hypothetical protein B0O99DRAFT_578591 [Bisporella sp. PMI_857]|nr:hypothetical protein B0O99DRAFT_578591 [Bisporella sp. PMI_857]
MSNSIELFYVFDNLSTEDQKRFKSLHGWRGINTNRITSIYMTNRFELGVTAGVFYKASRFNHACHPNATLTYAWREEDQKMVFSTLQPIKEGEEMTISYGNVAMLYHNYGFYCDCPKCPAPEYPQSIRKRCTDSTSGSQ